MERTRVGLLHPGAMGRTVGRALAASGVEVVWCSAGRSLQTRQRAEAEGFAEAATLTELVSRVSGIVSVCPPGVAAEVAGAVAAAGHTGWYLDANAVSPATITAVGAALTDAAELIDGGIVGPPAEEPDTTRLYLSGPGAEAIAELFTDGVLEPIVVSGTIGAASALKMLYAAYTKGTGALLLAIIAAAHRLGVDTTLQAEWERSLPDLPDRAPWLLRRSGAKAWRFEPEMREIAATLAAAGLPDGFHLAAAEVYHRLAELRLEGPVEPERTLRLLLGE